MTDPPRSHLRNGIRVGQLWLFPVKGLGGVEVERRRLTPRGLEGDRRWMVVDAEGQFVSQRTHPRMVLVRTTLLDRGEEGEGLCLAAPGMPDLVLDARPVPGARENPGVEGTLRGPEPPRLEAMIWGDKVQVVAPHPPADAWLSTFLGGPVRLVWQPDESRRPTDPAFAPGYQVSLADGYPLLVVSTASLEALNARLDDPIGMERFRPNLVVEGPLTPHAEDGWRRFAVGDVTLAGVKLCARCSVTTVDPATGERGKEPLRTLAAYRGWEGKVWFGQNAVPLGTGWVARGDLLRILETGPVGPSASPDAPVDPAGSLLPERSRGPTGKGVGRLL